MPFGNIYLIFNIFDFVDMIEGLSEAKERLRKKQSPNRQGNIWIDFKPDITKSKGFAVTQIAMYIHVVLYSLSGVNKYFHKSQVCNKKTWNRFSYKIKYDLTIFKNKNSVLIPITNPRVENVLHKNIPNNKVLLKQKTSRMCLQKKTRLYINTFFTSKSNNSPISIQGVSKRTSSVGHYLFNGYCGQLSLSRSQISISLHNLS